MVKKDPFEGANNQDKQHNRTKANIMSMTIGDMKINDPIVDQLLNACLVYDSAWRPSAHQIMRLQDQLEAQEYGYARSSIAMELVNREVPRSKYAAYLDSDPILAQLSS